MVAAANGERARTACSRLETPREIAIRGSRRPSEHLPIRAGESATLRLLVNARRLDDLCTVPHARSVMTPSGLRTPSTQRSNSPSPKPSFDAELLRTYMKVLLQTTLQTATWPSPRDRDRVRAWMKEIGERVKERMLGAHGLCLYRHDQVR